MKNLLMSSMIAVILCGVALLPASADLVQTVKACEEWYPLGEQVTFVYALKNTGTETSVYNFSSGKQFDVWVTFGGKEVYRVSRGMMYIQSFTNLTIGSGQTKEFRATWNQKDFQGNAVGKGWYTVHAQLESLGGKPYEVSSRIWIGELRPVFIEPGKLPMDETMKHASELPGETVIMRGDLRKENSQAYGSGSIDRGRPLQSRMILSDPTGRIDVKGIDPKHISSDGKVTLNGKISNSPTGQACLSVEKPKVPLEKSQIIQKSSRSSVSGGNQKPQ